MTQHANDTPLRRGIPAQTDAAFHPSRNSFVKDLEDIEQACERLSFTAGAEVFKMERLKHKTLPDVDAYWVMVQVHSELTAALTRIRGTFEAAGIIPPSIQGGMNGRSPMR